MNKNVFGKLAIAFVGFALVVGCKGKQTTENTPIESGATGTTTGEKIDSTPMNFDAQGSDSGKISGLATINFDYDKAALSPEAKTKLKANADWMKKNPKAKVQIEGHCDSRGTIEYNLALGERRAKSVRDYMKGLGVSADRLSTISYGKERPLFDGDSEAIMAKNRRANFVPVQ